MNNLHNNIAAMHKTGAGGSPSRASGGKDVQDLSGFLSQIMQAMNASPDDKTSSQKTQTVSPENKDLTAKIAAVLKNDQASAALQGVKTPDELAAKIASLLQQNNMVPESLQGLSPEDLAARISGLLQQSGAVLDPNSIKPSLTSDLAAKLAAQLQTQESLPERIAAMLESDKTATPLPTLADMLNDIAPGGTDDAAESAELTKILTRLQTHIQAQQQDPAITLDPAILQQLNDKIAQLLQKDGPVSVEDLATLKADIIRTLKDQGLDQPAIQDYLSSLAQSLREDTARTDKPAVHTDLTATLIHMAQPAAHKAQAQPVQVTTPKVVVPVAEDTRSHHLTEAAKLETPREQTGNSAPQAAPQQNSTANQQQATNQQNLSAKIAGISVNPAMINSLAAGDGGFNADGHGTGDRTHHLLEGAALLKPMNADALHAQNFTNYLSSARSAAPSAMTQMVNIQLQRNISAKIDTMTLQLDPADLGKLDIKLKFEKDGAIRAHLVAERPETLAMLQRDSHHLEKVLQQSGLNIDEKSLSFDLRHQNSQQNLEGFNGKNKDNHDEFNNHVNGLAAENAIYAQMAVQAPGYITRSGVNIMV